jgi:uncharacterized protein (TIGR03435 family)
MLSRALVVSALLVTALTGSAAAALAGGAAAKAEAPPAPGEKAPPIAVETLLQAPAGARAEWEKLRGKVVVLEFWATWCGPCVAALPHINELADRYKDKVQFIEITDEDRETVARFLDKRPMSGWVGLDTDRSVFDAYCVKGIPMTVLVRPDGVVDAVTYPTSLKPEHLDNLLAGKPSGVAPQGRVFILAGEVPGDDAHDALSHLLIRPSRGGGFGMVKGGAGTGRLGPETGFTAIGCTLAQLFPWVYDARTTRMVVTGRLPQGTFDVVVKFPRTAEKDFNLHLRHAVESTFGLKSRRETREVDVYVATVIDGGGKGLIPNKVLKSGSLDGGKGSIDAVAQTLAEVLPALEDAIATPVIDEMALAGTYDVHLRWDPAGGPAAIVRAAGEQLGLALTPAKRSIEVTVIEAPGASP